MPTDLSGIAAFINATGLVGGMLLILYGYFKGWWQSTASATREKAALQAQIDTLSALLAAQRADYEARLARARDDRAASEAIIRKERDDLVAYTRGQEAQWSRNFVQAFNIVDKLRVVTETSATLADTQGPKPEGGAG